MTTTATTGSQSFFSGLTAPDVVKEANGVLTSSPGTFGDLISPVSSLQKPETNAMRCALYFALGYLIAR